MQMKIEIQRRNYPEYSEISVDRKSKTTGYIKNYDSRIYNWFKNSSGDITGSLFDEYL